MSNLFRNIPQVSKIIDNIFNEMGKDSPLSHLPQSVITEFINEELMALRSAIQKGQIKTEKEIENELLTSNLLEKFLKKMDSRLEYAINGTGVVIHTNLGRSVLSNKALQKITQTACNYSTLEFDKRTGERGSRHSIVQDLLKRITKAEDALVVNNNAAAVMLVMSSLASGGETIISRGELVEVGGSFRIPDVMECSGSKLKEVGTTNKTHQKDYLNAINENTKAIMRVHTSNFRLIGFTSQVPTEELAKIAQENNLNFIEDLGSGSFIDFSLYGLPKEPTVQEVVSQGVDIVTFSGDKLLGGPQAGIIVGKKEHIAKIKQNQLLRALRPCKLTLAALEATLTDYLNFETARQSIPTLAMLTASYNEIETRAKKLGRMLTSNLTKDTKITYKKDSSRVGGGAFPEAHLPTLLVCIEASNLSVQKLKEKLLEAQTPIIGRIEENAFALDVRTLHNDEFKTITQIIKQILN